MPTPEQVRGVIQVYLDGFNKGGGGLSKSQKSAWLAAFAENAEQIDPVGTPARVGRQAIGAWYDMVFSLCDGVDLQSRELYVCGEEAALVFTAIQHRKDGQTVTLQGVDVFRVDESGKITSVKGYS